MNSVYEEDVIWHQMKEISQKNNISYNIIFYMKE